MTSIKAICLICTLSLCSLPVIARNMPQPHEMIRVLMMIQQKAVDGDRRAFEEQRLFLQNAGSNFLRADRKVWRDKRNVAAAAIYLFFGGLSSPIRELSARGFFAKGDRDLIDGALAFSEGRAAEALQHLAKIDTQKTSPVLAAPLMFTTASLYLFTNHARAHRLFDLVRLIAPGSIFEESALRRQVFLLDHTISFSKVVALVQRYERGFGKSPYANVFRKKIQQSISKKILNVRDTEISKILPLLEMSPAGKKNNLKLDTVRFAILHGKNQVAKVLLNRVLETKQSDQENRQRVQLYRQLTSLGKGQPQLANKRLNAKSIKALHHEDVLLQGIVNSIYSALAKDALSNGKGSADFSRAASWGDSNGAKLVFVRAKKALATSMNLLSGQGF